jgi:hypothetical protein
MAVRPFTAASFLQRWAAALALVLTTFNPSGYSYLHWVRDTGDEHLPVKVLAGIALLILFIIFLRATWRSIGPIGVGLAGAFFGAIVWILFYYDLLAVGQTTVLTYVGLVVVATIMAVGLSWSHIRRRLSGQLDIDDVDE